jgi:3-phenylpropionate/trans-cinnamate dioxygenase ferredoxin reductase component
MIAIVGAGAAGWSAAQTLRELGYGGAVHVFGAESAAPYERPALSKTFLTDPALDAPPALPADSEVAFEPGVSVVSIDRRACTLATSDGREHAYERLLLATGAAPRRLELPGADLAGIYTLRDVRDARALRVELQPGRRVAIVGGGVIGLEVAAAARARGCEATVVETAPRLMGRVAPPAFADVLEELHRARGIAVRTGARPIGFVRAGERVAGVALDGGGVVAADAVVVGVGAEPRVALAADAGLEVDAGVLVDARFTTSDERILAAGDVARVFHAGEHRHVRIEQWRPAQQQGRHAAAAMLGLGEAYRDTPWMWSDQGDVHVQASGFGFEDAELVRRGDVAQREGLAYLGVRRGRLVAVCGVSVGAGVARTVRAAQSLIECGASVDLDALRNPQLDLRRLARRLAAETSDEMAGTT